jgi:hypothetical protein
MTPVMVSIDQTPELSVGDASIVPLPGNGTPPRLGSVPANDESKTLALAGWDADASPSIPAIIMAAKVVANFIDGSRMKKRFRATSRCDPPADH